MVRNPSLLLRLRGVALDGGIPQGETALPLWKGSEKLSDFIERINRRVMR
jgi:hypothetical protein